MSRIIVSYIALTYISGSGKTSFLQNVLENEQGTKFGLLINDMASVNVDSKQIKKQNFGINGIDALELQNGCVCCSLAEDLIISVSKLVQLADAKGKDYDHIIIECSGIAEPRKIRELFQAAEDYGDALIERVKLDTLVTIIDASVFLQLFGSNDDLKAHTSLAMSENDQNQKNDFDDGMGMRKVTELLLEQVECADVVLINKIDLLPDPKCIEIVSKVVKGINPNAKVFSCVRGKLDAVSVVGCAKGEGAAAWGVLDEHRKLVQAAEHDSHSSEHSHSAEEVGHSHSSSEGCAHEEGGAGAGACLGSSEQDHGHEHSHHGEAGHVCDSTCNHDHEHSHTSDDHAHAHSHTNSDATTAETRFGITSFVYRRRRPFHPVRLASFLQSLGKLSVQGITEYAEELAASDKAVESTRARLLRTEAMVNAKRSILRSKGFVWMATSSAAAYFISHAGQYLELSILGRWWADIKQEDWPLNMKDEITIDFEGTHGDRRQELVFIGQFGKDEASAKKEIEDLLDACLLSNDEMSVYESNYRRGENALRSLFFSR